MTEKKPLVPIEVNTAFEKSMLDGLYLIIEAIVSIRKWVVFFGVMAVIGLIFSLLKSCGL
jgi:hypothetical protein